MVKYCCVVVHDIVTHFLCFKMVGDIHQVSGSMRTASFHASCVLRRRENAIIKLFMFIYMLTAG